MQQLESQAKKGKNKGKKPELSKVSQDDFDEDYDIAVPTTSAAKQSCSNAPDLFAEDVVSMKSLSSQKDTTYVYCD
jgi:hypothetical protein